VYLYAIVTLVSNRSTGLRARAERLYGETSGSWYFERQKALDFDGHDSPEHDSSELGLSRSQRALPLFPILDSVESRITLLAFIPFNSFRIRTLAVLAAPAQFEGTSDASRRFSDGRRRSLSGGATDTTKYKAIGSEEKKTGKEYVKLVNTQQKCHRICVPCAILDYGSLKAKVLITPSPPSMTSDKPTQK